MRLKITPLNILSAMALMLSVVLLVDHKRFVAPNNQNYIGLMVAFCLLVVFASFLADQVFRKLVPSLGRIWVLELALIALAVITTLVLKVLIIG